MRSCPSARPRFIRRNVARRRSQTSLLFSSTGCFPGCEGALRIQCMNRRGRLGCKESCAETSGDAACPNQIAHVCCGLPKPPQLLVPSCCMKNLWQRQTKGVLVNTFREFRSFEFETTFDGHSIALHKVVRKSARKMAFVVSKTTWICWTHSQITVH